MTQDLTVGKPISRIWQFAVPVLFGLLLQQVYSLVDTAIVGHALGVMALGGVGATGSVNFLVLGFCGGLCTGMAIPLAQAFGAGEYDRIRQGTYACLFIGILYCVLYILIAQFGTRYLSLLFMNADEAASVMSYTQQLSVANAYATPLLLGVNVLRLSIQGMGYSRLSLISGLLEMLARTAVSLWAVPAFGFDAACLASPLAWLLADCFLVPGFYGCLNARRRQAARVRKELPEE